MPLLISLSTYFPSCLFSFPTAGSACQGVFTSRDPPSLLHCFGRSETTVVPPGRDKRPIPFTLAKDFFALPPCFLFWASKVVIPWGFVVYVLFIAVLLVYSSAGSFSFIECIDLVVLSRLHVSAGLSWGSGAVIPWKVSSFSALRQRVMKGTRTPRFFGMKVGLEMSKGWLNRGSTIRGSGVVIPSTIDRIDNNISAHAFNVWESEDELREWNGF